MVDVLQCRPLTVCGENAQELICHKRNPAEAVEEAGTRPLRTAEPATIAASGAAASLAASRTTEDPTEVVGGGREALQEAP